MRPPTPQLAQFTPVIPVEHRELPKEGHLLLHEIVGHEGPICSRIIRPSGN
jgi:hypothetical protein